MGKYLSLTQDYVQQFKPIIEEKTGIQLEEIIVRNSSEYPNSNLHPHLYGAPMFVSPAEYPNTVFVKDHDPETANVIFASDPIDVVHELSHFIYLKLAVEKLRTIKSKPSRERLIKGWKSRSFKEGFAEYMSLDSLIDVYDDKTKYFLNSYHDDLEPRDGPHKRGYEFFRKVLGVIGKDKVFEVARSPPISEIEVRVPLLYLLRRYPAKGIRNAPKFFIKSIKTKIIKKLHGRAPFDF